MVLSTLHTNDGPQTLTRLKDMGIPSFAVATSVNVIIAQRLARCVCSNCKQPVEIPKDALLDEGFTEQGVELFEAVGCDQCNKGYKECVTR